MKFFLQLFFIFSVLPLLAQDNVFLLKNDSLVIRDEKLIRDLFGLEADPVKRLLSPASPGPQIQKQPVRSKHDDHAIDTAYRFAFGSDIFIVLKSGDRASVIHADVETPQFKTKQGIGVGMSAAEVMKALDGYAIKSLSRYLVLTGNEPSHYLIVYFKNGKVVFMEYFTPP